MTGQQFLDALQKQMMYRGILDKEYAAADLTHDASAAGLWYRHPGGSYKEQADAQRADEAAARDEMNEKIGGTR